jgi:hypothetical protein
MNKLKEADQESTADGEGRVRSGQILSPSRRRELVDAFLRAYPRELPRRLAWLADQLRIDRPRLLRLMGLPPEEVERQHDRAWDALVTQWPDRALWVEQLLRQLVAAFHYDWEELACLLHQQKLRGKFQPLAHTPGPDRERVLLSRIAEGGPDVLEWLVEYLSQPTGDPTRP